MRRRAAGAGATPGGATTVTSSEPGPRNSCTSRTRKPCNTGVHVPPLAVPPGPQVRSCSRCTEKASWTRAPRRTSRSRGPPAPEATSAKMPATTAGSSSSTGAGGGARRLAAKRAVASCCPRCHCNFRSSSKSIRYTSCCKATMPATGFRMSSPSRSPHQGTTFASVRTDASDADADDNVATAASSGTGSSMCARRARPRLLCERAGAGAVALETGCPKAPAARAPSAKLSRARSSAEAATASCVAGGARTSTASAATASPALAINARPACRATQAARHGGCL